MPETFKPPSLAGLQQAKCNSISAEELNLPFTDLDIEDGIKNWKIINHQA